MKTNAERLNELLTARAIRRSRPTLVPVVSGDGYLVLIRADYVGRFKRLHEEG